MASVALVQMKGSSLIEDNLKKAAILVEEGAITGAKIVALPEMFVCPYETALFPKYAELEGGPMWQALSEMARKSKVWLFGGSIPERDEEDKVYNTCFVFNPEGKQVGKHRKVHLFDIDIKGGQRFKESDTLTAGSDLCLIDTPYGKIGVMICFDVRFAEWASLLAEAGAVLLIVPGAFNMTTGPKHWELLMRSRALDNQLFVAAVSPARDREASYVAYGHSMIVDPWGVVIHQLEDFEGVLISEIDLEMVKEVREQLPVMSAKRRDLYPVASRTKG